jgi:hypothetical protein
MTLLLSVQQRHLEQLSFGRQPVPSADSISHRLSALRIIQWQWLVVASERRVCLRGCDGSLPERILQLELKATYPLARLLRLAPVFLGLASGLILLDKR